VSVSDITQIIIQHCNEVIELDLYNIFKVQLHIQMKYHACVKEGCCGVYLGKGVGVLVLKVCCYNNNLRASIYIDVLKYRI